MGYDVAKAEFKNPSPNAPPIFGEGLSSYEQMSGDYYYLVLLAAGLIGLGIIRLSVKSSQLAMLVSIANATLVLLILRSLWFLIGLKDPAMNSFLDLPFNELLMKSVKYDWIAIICSLAVLFVEFIAFFYRLLKGKGMQSTHGIDTNSSTAPR